jgi:hypothetical protein
MGGQRTAVLRPPRRADIRFDRFEVVERPSPETAVRITG